MVIFDFSKGFVPKLITAPDPLIDLRTPSPRQTTLQLLSGNIDAASENLSVRSDESCRAIAGSEKANSYNSRVAEAGSPQYISDSEGNWDEVQGAKQVSKVKKITIMDIQNQELERARKRMELMDLGPSRRDFVTSHDMPISRDLERANRIIQHERDVNQKGSTAAVLANKNKGQLHAWNNATDLWKDKTGMNEDQPDIMGGQSHRSRLNRDIADMGGQRYGQASGAEGKKQLGFRGLLNPAPVGPARVGPSPAGRGIGGRSGRGGPIRVAMGNRPSDPAVDPNREYVYRDKKKKNKAPGPLEWKNASPLEKPKAPLGPAAMRGSPQKRGSFGLGSQNILAPRVPPRAPRPTFGMHANNTLLDNQAFLRAMKQRHPSPSSGKEDFLSVASKQGLSSQGSSERGPGEPVNQATKDEIQKATNFTPTLIVGGHMATQNHPSNPIGSLSQNLAIGESREVSSKELKLSDAGEMKVEQMANTEDDVFAPGAARHMVFPQVENGYRGGQGTKDANPPHRISFEHHQYFRADLFPEEVVRRYVGDVGSPSDKDTVKSGGTFHGREIQSRKLLEAAIDEEIPGASGTFSVHGASKSLLGEQNLPGQSRDAVSLSTNSQVVEGLTSQTGPQEIKPNKIQYDADQLRAMHKTQGRTVEDEAKPTQKEIHMEEHASPVPTSPQLLLSLDTPPSQRTQRAARAVPESSAANNAKSQNDFDTEMFEAGFTRPLQPIFTAGDVDEGTMNQRAGGLTESGNVTRRYPNPQASVFASTRPIAHPSLSVIPTNPATISEAGSHTTGKPESQNGGEGTSNKDVDLVMKDSTMQARDLLPAVVAPAKSEVDVSQPKAQTSQNPFAKFSRPGGSIWASQSSEAPVAKAESTEGLAKSKNQFPTLTPRKGLGASIWTAPGYEMNAYQPMAQPKIPAMASSVAPKRPENFDQQKPIGLPKDAAMQSHRELRESGGNVGFDAGAYGRATRQDMAAANTFLAAHRNARAAAARPAVRAAARPGPGSDNGGENLLGELSWNSDATSEL